MNVVESRYNGKCTVQTYSATTKTGTHITRQTLTTLYSDKPCRLVVDSAPSVTDANKAPKVAYSATLLCSPSLQIPPGSKVTVTQDGRTYKFKASGMPEVYTTHQEISLETDEEWA